MKRILLLIAFPFWSSAQTLVPSAINSGGGFSSVNNINLVYSIGEIVTVNGGNQLSHGGFISSLNAPPAITAIEEQDNSTELFYPNPTSKSLSVNSEAVTEIVVYNLNGILVERSHQNTIDVSKLPDAAYIVVGRNAAGAMVMRQLIIKISK